MYCNNCGEKSGDKVRVCPFCGQKLGDSEAIKIDRKHEKFKVVENVYEVTEQRAEHYNDFKKINLASIFEKVTQELSKIKNVPANYVFYWKSLANKNTNVQKNEKAVFMAIHLYILFILATVIIIKSINTFREKPVIPWEEVYINATTDIDCEQYFLEMQSEFDSEFIRVLNN